MGTFRPGQRIAIGGPCLPPRLKIEQDVDRYRPPQPPDRDRRHERSCADSMIGEVGVWRSEIVIGLDRRGHEFSSPVGLTPYKTATQSISMSNAPIHSGTQTKMRAGGSTGKYRA